MAFQIGDKVIYPNHGLGVVEKDRRRRPFSEPLAGSFISASSRTKPRCSCRSTTSTTSACAAPSRDEEVERLFQLLGDGKIDNHQNWKGRFKDNSDKMRTGSIYDMADVLKSLTFLAKSKSLSFREKRMLDRAKSLIISEISEVMQTHGAGDRGSRQRGAREVLRDQGPHSSAR